ncbi:ATP-binding protein [Streptomyces cellulosae]
MTFRTPALKSSSFRVPSDLGAVSSARRRVVAIVRDWDVPLVENALETLELLAGELIANALVHTGKGCRVSVSWDGLRVRLEAEDTKGGYLPEWAPAGPDGESGRGLQLVDALAEAWGCRSTTIGKAVWFEIGGGSPSASHPPSAASGSSDASGGGDAQQRVAEPGSHVPGDSRTPVATT